MSSHHYHHQQSQQQQQQSPPQPPPPPLAHLQHNAISSAHAAQHAFADPNPPENSGPLTLPDRSVTAATIEDAYVRFIFYCNPALPPGADAQSLREAFRNPPRSGGKLFSPFTIFELVKKFYMKEIKTWTELTTQLGVEPPDPGKDESTQKIAQYGVRLKKWMNSMHIKAFFEYLMDIPNEYWTQIPDGSDPIAQPVRDGIAVEDDMSLRALLPWIRPKRGRKRPEDQLADIPTQKQRLSPPSTHDSLPSTWPKQSDTLVPRTPIIDPVRADGAAWDMNNSLPTPSDNWTTPGGGTPPTKSSFWDDALEQRPAFAPPKSKVVNQRRGAKNVSSAWKSSGWDPVSAKTRGRPPLSHRMKDEGMTVDSQALKMREATAMARIAGETHVPGYDAMGFRHDPAQAPILISPPQEFTQVLTDLDSSHQAEGTHGSNSYRQVSNGAGALVYRGSPTAVVPPPDTSQGLPHSHYAWRSNKELLPPSMQVPIPVSISTPIPISVPISVPISIPVQMMDAPPPASSPPRITSAYSPSRTNGSPPVQGSPAYSSPAHGSPAHGSPAQVIERADSNAGASAQKEEVKEWFFEKMADRANIDPMISYFTHVLHNAEWIDPQGNRQERGGMAECSAMANLTLESMYKNAESSQKFLINLSALAGARMLMTSKPRCYREETQPEVFTYHFDWQYHFGDLCGEFSMVHTVPTKLWKRQPFGDDFRTRGDRTMEPLMMEQWQNKYEALMEESEKLNRKIFEMQNRVMGALK